MKKLIIILLLPLLWLTASSQTMGLQTLEQLNESPAGSNIIAFLQTINSGEKINEATVEKLFASALIEKVGAKRLVGLLEEVRSTDGQLALYEAERTSRFEYSLKLKGLNHNEFLNSDITLENNEPYKIKGIGLDAGGEIPTTETPMLTPDEVITFKPKKKKFPSFEEISNKADEIAKAFEEMGWFAGTVLIAKNGKPFYEKGYGLADIENNVPNTIDTKYRIGSINKSYTDVLITQMVAKGILSFDDKLSSFNLGFPKEIGDKITLRHILTHSAGFSDIFIPKYLNNIRDYKDIDDILPLLLNEPLIYEPGKNRRYSNYGYIVLGAILEKISGRPFGELLQENILDVLNARSTHYDIAENIEGEAKSYRFLTSGKKIDHTGGLEYCTPDGGMYSTAKDLLAYYQALLYSEKLLSDEMKIKRFMGYKKTNKKWKNMIKTGGTIGDAGGGPGVSALVEMNLGANYTVIVLANTDKQVAEEVGLRIMSFIEGHGVEEIKLPPAHAAWAMIEGKDLNYLKKNFKTDLKEKGYKDYHSGILNTLGYDLMNEKNFEKAIKVFTLNTELFPKEANPYDSLGEAYFKQGNKSEALKYYQKALEIDPELPSAKEMVEKIKK